MQTSLVSDNCYSIQLYCGSSTEPNHCVDLFDLLKETPFHCPTCQTPVMTGRTGKRLCQATKLQLHFMLFEKKLHQTIGDVETIAKELLAACSESSIPPVQETSCTEKSDQRDLKKVLIKYADDISYLADRFPFRDIKGLELLWDRPWNIDNSIIYACAFPGAKTQQVFERFLQENDLSKEEAVFLEYGAGTAFWTFVLKRLGFKALAIDCKAARDNFYGDLASYEKILYVQENEIGLPQDCSKTILFLCWPEDPTDPSYGNLEDSSGKMYASRVLKAFRQQGGKFAIYIGKPRGGNTAAPCFFDELENHWNYTKLDHTDQAMQSRSESIPPPDSLYLISRKRQVDNFSINEDADPLLIRDISKEVSRELEKKNEFPKVPLVSAILIAALAIFLFSQTRTKAPH